MYRHSVRPSDACSGENESDKAIYYHCLPQWALDDHEGKAHSLFIASRSLSPVKNWRGRITRIAAWVRVLRRNLQIMRASCFSWPLSQMLESDYSPAHRYTRTPFSCYFSLSLLFTDSCSVAALAQYNAARFLRSKCQTGGSEAFTGTTSFLVFFPRNVRLIRWSPSNSLLGLCLFGVWLVAICCRRSKHQPYFGCWLGDKMYKSQMISNWNFI